MSRYATIITDNDGRELVSAVGEFEGTGRPDPRAGRVEIVAPGVRIGMVRGGPVEAVGGFGFPQGALGVNGRAVITARANLKALRDVAARLDALPAKRTRAKPGRKPARAKSARRGKA
ncbi:hypothetical protein [Mesorhizobium sp. INR15]|uniref:hypothetical protein n=1 Tax=Mesorhizobium sp. INR15 TaxID=2654248 RepID=UPI0018968A8C|nr:hypothetical protein [Mesorhizobium sp. INR15]QPC92080.1 hypothetical protein GA829_16670 [Mesorhizobium sp. INR15]